MVCSVLIVQIISGLSCIWLPVSASKILIMSIMPAAISVPEGCQDRDMIRPKDHMKIKDCMSLSHWQSP